ncbi:16S rRNA (guanine(966)-N(2))-methyltransferase RsmD [Cohnella terricola]|uniref:16S rRNA (Guanine(966)-N(2))-methyltransferase RsmD n=1 Tax=Cohnella terricola TaxID=1289167 RepID=A0A559JCX3_9BACL|nr:16S rRNA (guanine(966)-N(2))-methyltransferase RsmD [Cohnella terricola]TVX97719.1 16S rRNA (guanine(966)-N(2))-methyltransferase RsmD [Cohnella terricola]
MRVISGQAKGHPLKAVPGSNTRPTTDKVKEALFSMIGPYFNNGERVLDLFAGTGGLGIEALSRGAESAVFIDSSPQSVDVVRRNLSSTRLAERAEVYRNDARRALKLLQRAGKPFDLIFMDPPYVVKDCDALLLDLADKGLAAHGAIAVIEHHPDVVYPEAFGSFERSRYATYGEIALSIYGYNPLDEAEQTPSSETEEENEHESATIRHGE